jgi:3-hydroxyacyl-CoA dehydrogenase/enoyl-CoA hydratase/3-hydroxybutyryl-CoA epimerase
MTTTTSGAPVSTRTGSAIVKTEIRMGGIAILTLDDPRETHNTITPQLGDELTSALDALDANADVKAIVLRGKRDSFLAGANIDYVRAMRFAQEAEDASRTVAERFGRLAGGTKPVVACVHGPALGGGFELALACTAAVASDDPKTVLGLPEVKLGLMPAANGLIRVADRAGVRVATDLGLTGRSLRPEKALALGLVDEVVPHPVLLDASCALAKKLAERPEYRKILPRERRWKAKSSLLLDRNPIAASFVLARARAEAQDKTRGHYPAVHRMLDVLQRWSWRGFRSAAELEARLFGELVVSETSHRLVELFFTQTAMKKDDGLEPGETAAPQPVEHVAVLGAGLMGAGIACVSAQAGLSVRMKDRDDAALGRGFAQIDLVFARKDARERSRIASRISGTTDYSGMRRSDVVIEAVFEDLALKHSVIREIEKVVKDDCVIASNTSAIPIARIAEAATRPERVVGMHYFSPVPKMPLVEIVRTKIADPRAIATAVALAKRQKKTVIVVRDGTGFYTTRVLVPYLVEAAHLLSEGVPVDAIDHALVEWGFPVGPLQLLDEVGIDVAAHVTSETRAAFGDRFAAPLTLSLLEKDGRRGKKNGRGFYTYDGKKKRVDETVYTTLGITRDARTEPMHDEISLRCALAMLNEALRCLDEGILRSPRDGDVGAILGIGFPAFRGGPFRYVDVVGADEVIRRTRALEQRFGARFTPAPLLVELARKGKRLYG